ncbi:MAG: beta-glucosidase [Spirochaetaceae bacterium]|nr:MAG: beta-glucosidase [Spirochaetaceae bacterium]
MTDTSFPTDFLWGTATAAYQIEGAVTEGGRGESIWDRFSHTPGMVYQNQNGDLACDHYHRYREDIRLMKAIGLRSYRFSTAWSRIFPAGSGKINPPGLDFYQRLIDELLAAGIVPMITLYHWDLPQSLQDKGGWKNRDTVKYFTDYAGTMFDRFCDRVHLWITHNEPWVVSFLGHDSGLHAPGIQDRKSALEVSHNLLLSHAYAALLFGEYRRAASNIGITLNIAPAYPNSDSPEDEQAARYYDGYQNRWFLDPVFTGRYPEDMLEVYQKQFNAPLVEAEDLNAFQKSRIDFLGVNYYMRKLVCRPEDKGELFTELRPNYPGVQFTDMDWEVYADGLYTLLTRIQRDYDPPVIYVTENGIACSDRVDDDGQIRDEARIAYLRDHFSAAHRAMQEGVKLKGYYVWSLIDNFEWAYGVSKRFGIVYVDYKTQARTLKSSAHWYREVIGNSGF